MNRITDKVLEEEKLFIDLHTFFMPALVTLLGMAFFSNSTSGFSLLSHIS